MLSVKGLLGVVVTALILAVPISYYWGFLNRGRQPSKFTQRLDQLEAQGVPDFSLPDLEGKLISLSHFKGQPVLVNLWASWCGPCVKEFPSLEHVVEHFHGKLVVLAVSQDRTRDDLESFVKAFGRVPDNFIIVWDKDKITGELLGTDQLPETYMLRSDHRLVRKVVGEQAWDDPMALDFMEKSFW